MNNQRSNAMHVTPGLIAGLAGMVKNIFRLLLSRIELAALELAEVRTNVLKLLLVSALGILAVWFAIAFWSGLIVVLAWDSWGWKILLALAGLFTIAGLVLTVYIRSLLADGKLSMQTTMDELRNDRDALL